MSDPVEHSQNLRIRALEVRKSPAGATGPQGPPGPTGPPGPKGFSIDYYDVPAFGSWPADMSTLRIKSFNTYKVTDQYGILYIPTGFTQVFASCVATPTQDVENVHITPWIIRVSSLGTAGIWAWRITAGGIVGVANAGVSVAGYMIGC